MSERPNPYVGPRAFEAGETLYGRERELRQLKSLLVAERIVLLHSPSGAGKTSLIQAELMPRLREDPQKGTGKGFNVLPVIRINLEPPVELQNGPGFNRYTFSTLAALEEAQPAGNRLPNAELAALGLDAYLEKRLPPGDVVLIFDQFEEILTVSPADREAKAAFFAGLGAALRNEDCWALFSMREDFIGALDPYLRPIPNQLESRYRLDLLGPEAAKQAIQKPAREVGVDFTNEAAQKLVDDLRVIQVQQPDGSTEPQLGPSVEPVQLQVVCYRLWEATAGQKFISEGDLGSIGTVDEALAEYYAATLAGVVEKIGVAEADMREWFQYKLITKEGLRGQVLRGKDASDDLDNHAVSRLEDAHILRAEKRAGVTWYELAHDRLVEPIRTSNNQWFAQHMHILQVQASLWMRQNRTESLLLRGKDLEKVEKLAAGRQLSREEKEFLAASHKVEVAARREMLRNRLMTFLAIGATIATIVASILWVVAQQNATKAINAQATAEASAIESQKNAMDAMVQKIKADKLLLIAEEKVKIARAGELAAQAVTLHDSDFLVSSLLGVEAYKNFDTFQTRKILLGNLLSYPQIYQFMTNESYLRDIAISPDGKTLAAGSCDTPGNCIEGEITFWDLTTSRPIGQPLYSKNGMFSLAFSPDGKTLASGDWINIILWNTVTREIIGQPLPVPGGYVNSVAFSPDGKILVSGSGDGSITLWDVATQQPVGNLLGEYRLHEDSFPFSPVYSLALSPDGRTLASGGYDKTIILWDIDDQEPISEPLSGHSQPVASLVFSPDGKILASGSGDNTTILWDVATQQPIGRPLQGYSAAFSRDGKTLATSSAENNTIILWDVATQQPIGQPFNGPGSFDLIFSSDGNTLISGSANSNITLWDLLHRHPMSRLLAENLSIRDLAFSPDSKTIASGGSDQTIILLDVATGKPTGQPLTGHAGPVNSVAFSPDGKILASGSDDKTIILWNVADHKPVGQPLSGHAGPIVSIAFSPDGKKLASESLDKAIPLEGEDKTIIVWDITTGKPIGQNTIRNDEAVVNYMVFSPDGKTLAAILTDTIVLFDITAKQFTAQKFPEVHPFVEGIIYGLDGKVLTSFDSKNDIILWDVETRKPINKSLAKDDMTAWGGKEGTWSAAFSQDGKFAVGSNLTLWDVETRQPIGQLLEVNDVYNDVYLLSGRAFSPDGNLLASTNYDGTSIILWNMNPRSWVEETCQRIGRNFTRAEWAQYFPGEAYRSTCPQWPLEPEPTATP